ncbi:MAG: adenylosuccinate synthase [bacterium]|nr:adenylosuccinate synthase [bacterium]
MNLAVMGLQWGDEGKGKAIDYLAGDFDVVVRYQGGHNAGHTIYYQGKKVILHLLPSGIFSAGTVSVIGNGVVVNPIQLVEEIKDVETHGVSIGGNNLELSLHAPLILPEHEHLDIVFEDSRYIKIGTTRRGIGPAYEDLVGRRAVFVSDLLDKDTFYKKLKPLNQYYNKLIAVSGGETVDLDSYIDEYAGVGEYLKKFAGNTIYSLNRYYREGKRMLLEGAQGVLLDINFGTYPFVTSSNPTIGGLCTGTGLPLKAVGKLTGICKAYTTRVGGGPFPSELFDQEAEFLREKGSEYGATTGRPRRVGWLDLPALKYAIMINGIDEIFFTKLDVLDEFEEIKVVTAYDYNGETNQEFRCSIDDLDNVKPVLRSFPGWKTGTVDVREPGGLPVNAREYIRFIEEFIEIPLSFISVGSRREQTINRVHAPRGSHAGSPVL